MQASSMSREVIYMTRGRPAKCPYCGTSGESVSKGVRKTKTMGNRRIRLCKACGRKFTPRNQRPAETPQEPQAESSGEGEQAAATDRGAILPDEEPPPLLDSLDQEWTS